MPNILRSQGRRRRRRRTTSSTSPAAASAGRGYDAVAGHEGGEPGRVLRRRRRAGREDLRASSRACRISATSGSCSTRWASQIDAVTVSTPDHMHFPIAMAALALGKHVFVEKPLTHTVAETRKLAAGGPGEEGGDADGQPGPRGRGRPAAQGMGRRRASSARCAEVHSWTDRPIWPQGVKPLDHSKMMPVVPPTLDWDLWLGVAQAREYDPAYLPFIWRGFWDFGTAARSATWAATSWTAPTGRSGSRPRPRSSRSAPTRPTISAPTASVIRLEFPARGRHAAGPVDLVRRRPDAAACRRSSRRRRALQDNGTLLFGSKADGRRATRTTTASGSSPRRR